MARPLLPGMDFGNGDQPLTRGIEREIGKARAGCVGDPTRLRASLQPVDLLVLVVDEIDRVARDQKLAAAVLVHARARRERWRQHLLDLSALCPQDHLAPALLGPRFAPIDRIAFRLEGAKAAAALRDRRRCHRRRPGSERESFFGCHVDPCWKCCSQGRYPKAIGRRWEPSAAPVRAVRISRHHAPTHRHRRVLGRGRRSLLPDHLRGRRRPSRPARPSRGVDAYSLACRVREMPRQRRLAGGGRADARLCATSSRGSAPLS